MTTYKVVRFYKDRERGRALLHHVTLEEAQKHCHDPETSSETCTKSINRRRTRRLGAWFDGYTEEL